MTTVLPKLPPPARVFRELLLANAEHIPGLAAARVGGDFAYNRKSMPFYVRIESLPGSSWQLGADLVIDVEVFAQRYLEAEDRSFDIERIALGYPHVVRVDGRTVVLDKVTLNTGPAELPWSDEGVTRMGATYVISIRRH